MSTRSQPEIGHRLAQTHGRIAPARARKRDHEPEERRLAQARVLRQFEEACKECFERLEHPFAFAIVCVAVDDEERVVMVTVMDAVHRLRDIKPPVIRKRPQDGIE